MRTLLLSALLAAMITTTGGAAINPTGFDPKIRPQDDFFEYVNGPWLRTVVIPPALARYASFNRLQEENWTKLHDLCAAAAAKGGAAQGAERLVGDFYASGIDLAQRDAEGARPLEAEFARLSAVKTPADVMRALGHLKMLGVHAGFEFSSAADDRDSRVEIARFAQGGLGLAISDESRDADRDYYLDDSPARVKLRQAYVAHIARMFEMLGDAPPAAQAAAARVLALETRLAQVSSSRVALRDPIANYHKLTRDQLQSLVGNLDLGAYLGETNAPTFTVLNVAQPEFLRGFADTVRTLPIEDWRAYLRWQLIRRTAPFLGQSFAAEHFRFFGTEMTGVSAEDELWRQVVGAADANLGDALGQLYVAHFFPPEAKARALQLVANVRAALRERLQNLEWMDAPTRRRAVEKLDAFTVKIGYPDRWKDYAGVRIDRGPYVLNVLRAADYNVRRDLAKIGGPVDKSEWEMTAPTVNAYYSSHINGITFPAGILQPPFFDAKADDALNYGGIGVVIGHEMTHGFDDSGRKYDAAGNLDDWWSPASAAAFQERAQKIVDQFSAYIAVGDIHLNGRLTEGENIADLGGLRVAYAALQKALAGKAPERIDGFTPEQRFFISHALVWRDVMRPAEAARRAAVDPHSPGRWRVDGPLSNLDEFARAFDVPEGAPMRRPPAERVLIW